MSTNCSHDISPNITTFFKTLTELEKIFVGLEGGLCVVMLLLFLDDCYYFSKRIPTSSQLRSILIIQATFVVYASTSFLSIISPRSSILSELVFTVFLSFTLKELVCLIISYLGGESEAIVSLRGSVARLAVTPVACCCCCCCPKVHVSRKFFKRIKIGVYQTAIVHPIFDFISVVLWNNGLYIPGKSSPTHVVFYITLFEMFSVVLAMYASTVLYVTCRHILKPHNITGKFICVQITMLISGLQQALFSALASVKIIRCTGLLNSASRAAVLHNCAVVPEMMAVYTASRLLYRNNLNTCIVVPCQVVAERPDYSPISS